MNIITKNIPNAVTCLNLVAGVTAIIFATKGLETIGSLYAWQWAAICIGIAAVADFMDGFCARLLKAYSDLGKELDSLCDLVSFGVAPAMIMFHLMGEYASTPAWLPWLTLLIPVAGALRLARFNIDTRQTTSFIGLPIPANAIFWIGYAAMSSLAPMLLDAVLLSVVIVVESYLMVSPLKLFSLKFKTWGVRGNEARYMLIVSAAVFIFCLGVSGLMWLIIFYIALSQLPFARK